MKNLFSSRQAARLILLGALFWLGSGMAAGQCPHAGSVHLTIQLEVTNFVNDLNLNGCHELDGTLEIGPSSSGLDISSLSVLHSITGDLFIHDNNGMTSATGLNNLTFVGNSIYIQNNPNLLSINLLSVTSGGDLLHFFVYGNTALETLNAPNGISTITGAFHLFHNPALISFSGFSGLAHIDGSFQFDDTQVSSLSNLNNLETVGGTVHVVNNPNLSTCSIPVICDRVATNNLPYQISGNAVGCKSRLQNLPQPRKR